MAEFKLYIGYRHVSSWSLRAWMAMRKTGVPFEERMIRYRVPEQKRELVAASPTGKVPLLVHQRPGAGEVKVWESLSIGEYLADYFPQQRLWPEDPAARAFARSVATEMHSGFRPLRDRLSMALLETRESGGPYSDEVKADIARIDAIWTEARTRYAKETGPFLFGHFTVTDAMYTPVVTRFRTYGVTLSPVAQEYAQAMLADPDFQAWEASARREPEPEPLVA